MNMKDLRGIERMGNKKKLLFHINSMGKGGAERVVSVLSEKFARDGYEVVIATLWRAKEEYQIPEGVKRINLGDNGSYEKAGRIRLAFRRLWDLRRLIKEEAPDLVISFCNKANFRSSYCMLGMKTPLLVSVRNDPRIDYFPHKYGVRRMKKKASGCVFQTEDAKSCFDVKFQKKSKVILNPIDEKYFIAEEQRPEPSGYLVTVGRLSMQKNQLLLLKAFSLIREELPGVQLRIYGEESDQGIRDMLTKYVEQRHMQDSVLFMGQSSHLEREIRDAALFVLSSDYEGMPNALMEAMAMGIPVISTDCPCKGPAELIEDGISGLLVPVGEEKEMAYAMRRVLKDRELWKRLSRNGMEIRKKASPDRVYKEWKAFVEEIIE